MKYLFLSVILTLSGISFSQKSHFDSSTGQTIMDHEYEKRILGRWLQTDVFGVKTDENGDETWGLYSMDDSISFEFFSDSLTVTDINTGEKSTSKYQIIKDELFIGNHTVLYICYINEKYEELMLFGGYKNSQHFKFNKNPSKKSEGCN